MVLVTMKKLNLIKSEKAKSVLRLNKYASENIYWGKIAEQRL